MDKKFNMHFQWKLFLEKLGIEEHKLPANQQAEMKKAFYGGAGQLLLLFRNDMQEVLDKQGEAEASKIFQVLLD